MGIPALIWEPLLLARTNEKSRFFRLPSDSLDAFVADFISKQCGTMNKINSWIIKYLFLKKSRWSSFIYIFGRLIIEQNATKKDKTPK